jgi:hypothetical protein
MLVVLVSSERVVVRMVLRCSLYTSCWLMDAWASASCLCTTDSSSQKAVGEG